MDQGDNFNRPGFPSHPEGDPFSDRAPRVQGPYDPHSYSSQPGPYTSNVSLPGSQFDGHTYAPQDDEEEKHPLTSGEAYAGGFYPPSG